MADFFFCGTLCHPPLLAVVLGREPAARPARLKDHALRQAMDGALAILVAEPGAAAEGILVGGIGPAERARLDHYAGGFGFDSAERVVETAEGPVNAHLYLPRPGAWTAGAPWRLDDWQAVWGAVATEAARDVMAAQGTLPAEAVRTRYAQMLVRAASRLAAGRTGPASLRHDARPGDVEVLARHLPYARYFAVEEYDLRHRRFDGTTSPPIRRACFVSGDAVTVLPYDPARDRVLVIQQFRAGPLARGDRQCWQIEAIAGRIDPTEDAEAAARREAREEAGLELGALLPVAAYYPSPGAVSEYIFSFVAPCDLPADLAGVHGKTDEDEDIRSHVIGFDRLMALVASGEIANAPLVLTALWLQRERPRLRGALQV